MMVDGNIEEAKRQEVQEKHWPQVLAVLIGCLAVFSDGLLAAWCSPFLVKIVQDKENFDISEREAYYFAILPPFSMMLSCFFFAVLFDKIGRKPTLMISVIPQLLSWLLTIFAKSAYVFYLSRILAGIGSGCIFATMPVYVGETASPKIRGFTGSCITSVSFFGQFVVNVIGNYFDVRTTAYICIPFPVIFFVLFYFMPETPLFYVMQKRFKDAESVLKTLTRRESINDFSKLKSDIERQLSERGKWKDLMKINSNRRAVSIGFFLRISQQLGGMAIYTTCMLYIFEKTNGNISSKTASNIFMFSTFICYFIAGIFSDKLGRRLAYTASTFLSSLIFFSEALYFYLEQYQSQIDISALNLFPLIGMVLCIVVGSFGIGVVPTIMIGELFSASIKAKASILMVFAFGSMMFLSTNIFFYVNAATGLCGPFLFFGLINLVSSVVAYFCLPETRGKTLEEIQQLLKSNKLI